MELVSPEGTFGVKVLTAACWRMFTKHGPQRAREDVKTQTILPASGATTREWLIIDATTAFGVADGDSLVMGIP
jgi:hypothetical protein